jgi:DNA-binding LytR/AlgR family response regulator
MDKFCIKTLKGIVPVEIDKLVVVKVEQYISTFEFENGQHIHCVEPLKYIEQKFGNDFIRINRNMLVNINKIEFIDIKKQQLLIKDKFYKISCRNIKILMNIYKRI